MELRLPLEMSPGREAACRAVFGTWGFFLKSSSVNVASSVDCKLKWDKDSRVISVKGDVQWTIGDNDYPLKAVFLCNKSDDYVLGYCIHTASFTVTNKVKIEDGTILWSIVNE